MLKAIIFDLNGFFIDAPPLSERFAESFGVPVETFLPALKAVMASARLPGAGDSFALWQPYLKEWNVALTREQFFDFWFSAEADNPRLLDFAARLSDKGLRLFLVSNNFSERTDYYAKRFPWINELFEKAYYSWQTGLVKPDPEAYRLILSENGLDPLECAYFDDSAGNISAAASLGIRAFPADRVEKELGALLVSDVSPLLEKIAPLETPADRPFVIAVSGFGGSGKSSAAQALTLHLGDAELISLDDFIVDRLFARSEDWEGFDRERFKREVLEPARAGKTVTYDEYNWPINGIRGMREVAPRRYLVVEGCSVLHPDLLPYYDLTVWLDVPQETAMERGMARDKGWGEDHDAEWRTLWGPNDRDYFAKYRPDKIADIVFKS